MRTSDKKNEILDCAQVLIQKRGYNGFSYADISTEVGIRKASIHHYFPSKVDLAVAIIERYREGFNACLVSLNSQQVWTDKIRLYIELYKQVLDEGKLCLCGMLASDMDTLPEKVKKSVRDFFSDNVHWLTEVLVTSNPSQSKQRLQDFAWQLINTLQGGVIVARVLQDPAVFNASCEEMMSRLKQLS